MAEFFSKLSPVTLRKPTFSRGSRLLKNLSTEVLVLNNEFNIQRVLKLGFLLLLLTVHKKV